MALVPQSILDLDLRPDPPAKIEDEWGWIGDFPVFPERLAHFIEFGKFPQKRVIVKIRISTSQFMESIRLATEFTKSLALTQKSTKP